MDYDWYGSIFQTPFLHEFDLLPMRTVVNPFANDYSWTEYLNDESAPRFVEPGTGTEFRAVKAERTNDRMVVEYVRVPSEIEKLRSELEGSRSRIHDLNEKLAVHNQERAAEVRDRNKIKARLRQLGQIVP